MCTVQGSIEMCVDVCVCVCEWVSVWLFLVSRIGIYHHYFLHSTSSIYWSLSGSHDAWIAPSASRLPLCSLLLQYSLNTRSMKNGTVVFGQRLTGMIKPSLTCSSVSMMSPSNLPLRSHSLCNFLTSATKLNGNLLCVATGCSSCRNSPAVRVEQLVLA
jgi:hypothetical protein